MATQAFIDESGRGPRYYVCVSIVPDGDVAGLRPLARSFCLPGQWRWHFVHERVSRRRQITDAIVASGQVSALSYYGKGEDPARSARTLGANSGSVPSRASNARSTSAPSTRAAGHG